MAVVELFGATTTKTRHTIECALDERTYEKSIRISKADLKTSTSRAMSWLPDVLSGWHNSRISRY